MLGIIYGGELWLSTKGTSHLRGGDGGGDGDRGVVMVIVVVMMVMVLDSSLPDTSHKKIINQIPNDN